VTVTVSSNSASTFTRSGSANIAGQGINFSQGGTQCSYSLRTLTAGVPATGGSGDVGVVAPQACIWTATSNASWLTIASSGIAGTADVLFVAQANTSGSPQTGTLTVAGQTFTVTEAAAPCAYTLGSQSNTVGSPGVTGATLSFSTTQNGCTVAGASVTSFANWITASNTSAGSGQVTYNVAPNPAGVNRSGIIEIGNQPFTVTESGAACAYSLAAYGQAFGQLGGAGDVAGSQSANGCTPTVGVDLPSIVTLGSLSGPAANIFTMPYTVNAFNSLTNATRRATINFGGQLYTVKQTSY